MRGDSRGPSGRYRLLKQLIKLLDLFAPATAKRRLPERRTQEFAVIGLGRFGSSLALTLVKRGHTVLGIDNDPEIAQAYSDLITQTASLNSSDEDALREIDIAAYDTVIVAIGSNFESNMLTTAALKSLGVRNVICKAASMRQRDILNRVGADRVVLPEHEAGVRLAEEVAVTGVLDQIELGAHHRITEIRLPKRLAGMSLGQAQLPEKYGIRVLAIQRQEDLTVMPDASFTLFEGDFLVLIGRDDAIESLALG
jgi:trk system potassium uptake protein